MSNNIENLIPESIKNKQNRRGAEKIKIIILITLIITLTIFIVYLKLTKSAKEVTEEPLVEDERPIISSSPVFASYQETSVDVDPKVPSYSINQDLSNVSNINDFNFSSKAKELIARNGFVVVPSDWKEFFPLYETNRYDFRPSFITTDSILHNYHLVFAGLLRRLEEQELLPELKKLTSDMLLESLSQYQELEGTEWEQAAKRNVGFFSVGSSLLDSQSEIPSIVVNEVNQELELIENHKGIDFSPVMNIGNEKGAIINTPQGPQALSSINEDYSQYIPRGHYDKTEELKAYFKSMMWYGRLTFRMKSDDEIRSAMLITTALNKEENHNRWNRIYEPINFFVGKSDDITYYQFEDLMSQIYNDGNLSEISNDKSKFLIFSQEIKEFEPPRINSIPIFEGAIQPDREEEIKGFRFMGQRFTIDASIFQRLIYRDVGDKTTSCSSYEFDKTGCLSGARCLPKGLDIPAAMGSVEAFSILDNLGETDYACYKENLLKLREYTSDLDTKTWTQNLYWGWLYQLKPLFNKKSEGYPLFMQNQAWERKDLNTFLGSWTELKHDTILYSKQVYAEMGGSSFEPEEKDDRGYVEPNPYLYARLASLVRMTSEGLEARNLLSSDMKENLKIMEQLSLFLKTISEKELNNESLSEDDYELIRSYGGQLEHLWIEINKDEPSFQNTPHRTYLDENPVALVADVATDPNGRVLEEAIGDVFEIYVVVPIDGELRIAKGGVYSYYEFEQPISERLTDKKWREMIDPYLSKEIPSQPEWTNLFTDR